MRLNQLVLLGVALALSGCTQQAPSELVQATDLFVASVNNQDMKQALSWLQMDVTEEALVQIAKQRQYLSSQSTDELRRIVNAVKESGAFGAGEVTTFVIANAVLKTRDNPTQALPTDRELLDQVRLRHTLSYYGMIGFLDDRKASDPHWNVDAIELLGQHVAKVLLSKEGSYYTVLMWERTEDGWRVSSF